MYLVCSGVSVNHKNTFCISFKLRNTNWLKIEYFYGMLKDKKFFSHKKGTYCCFVGNYAIMLGIQMMVFFQGFKLRYSVRAPNCDILLEIKLRNSVRDPNYSIKLVIQITVLSQGFKLQYSVRDLRGGFKGGPGGWRHPPVKIRGV